jgi:hypothetical protein
MLVELLLDVNVATDRARGVLGITIPKHQEKNNQGMYVFVYIKCFYICEIKEDYVARCGIIPRMNRLRRQRQSIISI